MEQNQTTSDLEQANAPTQGSNAPTQAGKRGGKTKTKGKGKQKKASKKQEVAQAMAQLQTLNPADAKPVDEAKLSKEARIAKCLLGTGHCLLTDNAGVSEGRRPTHFRIGEINPRELYPTHVNKIAADLSAGIVDARLHPLILAVCEGEVMNVGELVGEECTPESPLAFIVFSSDALKSGVILVAGQHRYFAAKKAIEEMTARWAGLGISIKGLTEAVNAATGLVGKIQSEQGGKNAKPRGEYEQKLEKLRKSEQEKQDVLEAEVELSKRLLLDIREAGFWPGKLYSMEKLQKYGLHDRELLDELAKNVRKSQLVTVPLEALMSVIDACVQSQVNEKKVAAIVKEETQGMTQQGAKAALLNPVVRDLLIQAVDLSPAFRQKKSVIASPEWIGKVMSEQHSDLVLYTVRDALATLKSICSVSPSLGSDEGMNPSTNCIALIAAKNQEDYTKMVKAVAERQSWIPMSERLRLTYNNKGPLVDEEGWEAYPSMREAGLITAELLGEIDEIFVRVLLPEKTHFATRSKEWLTAMDVYKEKVAMVFDRRWIVMAQDIEDRKLAGINQWTEAMFRNAGDNVRVMYHQLGGMFVIPPPLPTPSMVELLPSVFGDMELVIKEVARWYDCFSDMIIVEIRDTRAGADTSEAERNARTYSALITEGVRKYIPDSSSLLQTRIQFILNQFWRAFVTMRNTNLADLGRALITHAPNREIPPSSFLHSLDQNREKYVLYNSEFKRNSQYHPENDSFMVPDAPAKEPSQPKHKRFNTIQRIFHGTTWVRPEGAKDSARRSKRTFAYVMQETEETITNEREALIQRPGVPLLRNSLERYMKHVIRLHVRPGITSYSQTYHFGDPIIYRWWDDFIITQKLLDAAKPQEFVDVNVQVDLRKSYEEDQAQFAKVFTYMEKELANNMSADKKDRVLSATATSATRFLFSVLAQERDLQRLTTIATMHKLTVAALQRSDFTHKTLQIPRSRFPDSSLPSGEDHVISGQGALVPLAKGSKPSAINRIHATLMSSTGDEITCSSEQVVFQKEPISAELQKLWAPPKPASSRQLPPPPQKKPKRKSTAKKDVQKDVEKVDLDVEMEDDSLGSRAESSQVAAPLPAKKKGRTKQTGGQDNVKVPETQPPEPIPKSERRRRSSVGQQDDPQPAKKSVKKKKKAKAIKTTVAKVDEEDVNVEEQELVPQLQPPMPMPTPTPASTSTPMPMPMPMPRPTQKAPPPAAKRRQIVEVEIVRPAPRQKVQPQPTPSNATQVPMKKKKTKKVVEPPSEDDDDESSDTSSEDEEEEVEKVVLSVVQREEEEESESDSESDESDEEPSQLSNKALGKQRATESGENDEQREDDEEGGQYEQMETRVEAGADDEGSTDGSDEEDEEDGALPGTSRESDRSSDEEESADQQNPAKSERQASLDTSAHYQHDLAPDATPDIDWNMDDVPPPAEQDPSYGNAVAPSLSLLSISQNDLTSSQKLSTSEWETEEIIPKLDLSSLKRKKTGKTKPVQTQRIASESKRRHSTSPEQGRGAKKAKYAADGPTTSQRRPTHPTNKKADLQDLA